MSKEENRVYIDELRNLYGKAIGGGEWAVAYDILRANPEIASISGGLKVLTETLTKPIHGTKLLSPIERAGCRESLARVKLALADFLLSPPSCRTLPGGLLQELDCLLATI